MTTIGLSESSSLNSNARYHSLQILASIMHLIASSVLSYCISRRTPALHRWGPWRHLTWGRACMILVLLDSWTFVFFSGVLSLGVGLVGSHQACAIAIVVCIICYGSTKLLIYAFLVEKVYIVWASGNQTPRFKTPVYRICCAVQLGYAVVVILGLFGRQDEVNSDGICVLGLKRFVTIPLVVYELMQNVFFTGMFLWPLWTSQPMNPWLRVLAKRTLYAACGSLTVSAINVLIMIGFRGKQLGWICLTSCVIDVTINAILLFWLSAGSTPSRERRDRFSLPHMDMTALTLTIPELAATTTTTTEDRTKTKTTGISTRGTSLVSPMSSTFPDELFDYIPEDHRHQRDEEEEGGLRGCASEEGTREFNTHSDSEGEMREKVTSDSGVVEKRNHSFSLGSWASSRVPGESQLEKPAAALTLQSQRGAED